VRCSEKALFDAVEYMTGQMYSETVEIESPLQAKTGHEDSNPFQWGDVLCALCHYYPGTRPEYWLWECSIEFTETMLSKVSRFVPSFGEKVDGAKFEAFAEFRSIVLHIIRRSELT
jgi:hypothetical protein